MSVTAADGVAAAVVKRFAPRRQYRVWPTLRECEAGPQRIRRGHLLDELPNRRNPAGPANTRMSRTLGPPASEPLPMPAHNRVWLDDDERRAPVPPSVGE